MINLFRRVTTVFVILAFAVFRVPLAHAGPDAHIPEPLNGCCPGGVDAVK